MRQIARAAVCSLVFVATGGIPAAIAETPVKIVALGDSLTAGLGLPEKDGFVPRLQIALTAKGIDCSGHECRCVRRYHRGRFGSA